jgi:hypothetical protein
MYTIRFLENVNNSGRRGAQADHRRLMYRCGILYENSRWHHAQGLYHYWEIECDKESLALLVLSGGQIVN